MSPQATVNYVDEKLQNYAFDLLSVNVNFFLSNLESFDKFSGHTFTTYTSRTKNLVNGCVEHAKEVARTGNIKPKV